MMARWWVTLGIKFVMQVAVHQGSSLPDEVTVRHGLDRIKSELGMALFA